MHHYEQRGLWSYGADKVQLRDFDLQIHSPVKQDVSDGVLATTVHGQNLLPARISERSGRATHELTVVTLSSTNQ
jgi:hypothetical protein